MEYLRLAFRYLHLAGFALLVGAWAVQFLAGKAQVTIPMRVGMGMLLGSAVVLAIPFPSDVELDYTKLAVKLAVAICIGVLFGIEGTRARAGKQVSRGLFGAIGGLALLNAAIGVFWQ